MTIAMMLLHTDCPTISEACPTPPKLQLVGHEDRLYGRCVACEAWALVEITPLEDTPVGLEYLTQPATH